MAPLLSFIGFVEGWLHVLVRRDSALCLLCFALTNVGSIAAEVLPPGLTTNTVERLTTVESFAPVPVPEPSEKTVQFYRSGIVWWLLGEGWSWFVPAVILFSGFSGWLGRHAKRIGRWEVSATFVFVLLYMSIAYVLSFPMNYFRDFVRLHEYGLSNQTFARWLDHSLKEGVRKWVCRFRILLSHLRFSGFVRSAFQIKTQLPWRQLAQG